MKTAATPLPFGIANPRKLATGCELQHEWQKKEAGTKQIHGPGTRYDANLAPLG